MEQLELLCTDGVMLNVPATLSNGLTVSNKVKHIPIQPSHSMPRYLPKRKDGICHIMISTRMFTAASCVMAKHWQQPKGAPTAEGINRSQCIISAQWNYCTATKGNEPLRCATQMNLKITVLGGRSQTPKNTGCVILLTSNASKCSVP